jgi:predicted nucleic acid-binding protein
MIVVDASIALKWVISETDSAKARTLHDQALIAPAIWLSDVSNALWRHVRLKQLTNAEAKRRFSHLKRATIETVPIERDMDRALEIALEIDHPVYDCLYLALAVRESTYVVTADARFASAARRNRRFNDQLRLLSEL